MVAKHSCTVALFYVLALVSMHSAQAGQLFPPSNIGSPASDCPNGQVLTWKGNGTVQCADPTPGVTTALCPAGQVLNGIVKGVPSCIPNGGGTGWVAVSGCANPSGPSPWGSYGVQSLGALTWCTTSKSPEQICQDAGYNKFVGSCKATGFNGATPTQGALGSYSDATGVFLYKTPVGGWTLDCLAGSQTGQGSGVNLTILCGY